MRSTQLQLVNFCDDLNEEEHNKNTQNNYSCVEGRSEPYKNKVLNETERWQQTQKG